MYNVYLYSFKVFVKKLRLLCQIIVFILNGGSFIKHTQNHSRIKTLIFLFRY